jgi:hypothetical protein
VDDSTHSDSASNLDIRIGDVCTLDSETATTLFGASFSPPVAPVQTTDESQDEAETM